jgi:uncharacterized membrane protein
MLQPKRNINYQTMEIKWIVISVVLVCVAALTVYLIVRNEKDKKDLTKYLNETELKEEPNAKGEEEDL